MYISNFFVQDLLYFNLYKQLEFQDLWNILHLFQAKFMETKNVNHRDFNKGRHPAICRRFKRVKSPVRLLETKIFVH